MARTERQENKEIMWNYEESVKRVSAKVKEWKAVTLKKSTLTDEIAQDLYEAREQLDSRGLNKGNQNVSNGTFSQYLNDVGLARVTVYRWLESYDPQEQRLLTDDEYKRKEQEKQRKKMEHEKAVKAAAQEYYKTGVKPNDWNNESEKAYQALLEEEQRKREWKERIQRETEEREKKHEKFSYSKSTRSAENIQSILDELSDSLGPQLEERKKFAEQARLTGDNAGHGFNQLLRDYLDNLGSDSERLEACHNIIKICKSYVTEYQRKSV